MQIIRCTFAIRIIYRCKEPCRADTVDALRESNVYVLRAQCLGAYDVETCSACHSKASGYQKDLAERSLIGISRPFWETLKKLIFIKILVYFVVVQILHERLLRKIN